MKPVVAKLVYFVQNKDKSNVNELGGKLHFIKFKTADIDDCLNFIIVNIRSGVSIIKVENETNFQRVDGTSLGGGTFWGLCSLLTGVSDYDEMLEMTKNGQSNHVDLVVGDIYGMDYTKIGLSSDTIATQSLLKMVSNNISQIAYLNSQRYGLNKIYFDDFFIRDHPNTMQRISFAL
ncbi:hypothetical protein ACTFIW_012000 [Dictyostelium discoideum]